ncbi:hypothetical protein VF21_07444 [Pseudogymnoascus sp. 05NY08]|nr:hypothetical protein VF21_07444 [Pseudogymnoascus sp. 05NY08]
MCDYYLHIHACTHTSSALGRFCPLPDGCDDCGGDPEVHEQGPEKPKKGRIGIVKKRVVRRR